MKIFIRSLPAFSYGILTAGVALAGSLQGDPANETDRTPFAIHEWGTFTSYQGSDGDLIPWDPFQQTDLPAFVYDRRDPFHDPSQAEALQALSLNGLKRGMWLQRMETPVIYFHAAHPLTVDVHVGFPKGNLTEWYPAVTDFGPTPNVPGRWSGNTTSHLAWRGLQVAGPGGFPALQLPSSDQPSHYFAARATSANPIQTSTGLIPSQAGQQEKFLFYRGAGNFPTPLQARWSSAGDLELSNTGDQPLTSLFFYEVRDGLALWQPIPTLAPQGILTLPWSTLKERKSSDSMLPQADRDLWQALQQAGLFPDEARAMLDTWRKDWFGENGTRVLYLLPQAWTDATLPLQITPAPAQAVRVMVGRAEMMSPETEDNLRQSLVDYLAQPNAATLAALAKPVERRFLEPALNRVAGQLFEERRAILAPAVPASHAETFWKAQEQSWNTRLQEVREALALIPQDSHPAQATPGLLSGVDHLQVFSCAPQGQTSRGRGTPAAAR